MAKISAGPTNFSPRERNYCIIISKQIERTKKLNTTSKDGETKLKRQEKIILQIKSLTKVTQPRTMTSELEGKGSAQAVGGWGGGGATADFQLFTL